MVLQVLFRADAVEIGKNRPREQLVSKFFSEKTKDPRTGPQAQTRSGDSFCSYSKGYKMLDFARETKKPGAVCDFSHDLLPGFLLASKSELQLLYYHIIGAPQEMKYI